MCAGVSAHAKPPVIVGVCMGISTSGKCSPCLGSLHLWLARVERRSLCLAQDTNSSIFSLDHMDESFQKGNAAIYTCAAGSSAGASQAPLLRCNNAVRPADPQAGPKPHLPWVLRQGAVRKDSLGAIINTGHTANSGLQTI